MNCLIDTRPYIKTVLDAGPKFDETKYYLEGVRTELGIVTICRINQTTGEMYSVVLNRRVYFNNRSNKQKIKKYLNDEQYNFIVNNILPGENLKEKDEYFRKLREARSNYRRGRYN